MAVQLTEGWWKTAWPSDTPPKSYEAMKKAIKNAKAAKRGLSKMDYIASLTIIQDIIKDLEAEAAKQFRTTVTSKVKAKKMLAEFRSFIETQEAGVDMDAKPVTVFKKSFGDAVKAKVKHRKAIEDMDKMEVSLDLMTWLVNELRDKNAEAMLNKALNREFDKKVDEAAKYINDTLGGAAAFGLAGRTELSKIAVKMNQKVKELEPMMQKVPAEVLRKIGINEKMAKKYKMDQKINIATGLVGTGLAVGGVFVPGTTAFAIVGACRSGAALLKDLSALTLSIEKKIAIFEAYLVALREMFSAANKKKASMSKSESMAEFTLASMNTVLGIDVMPTIKKANDSLKSIEGQLAVMSMKSQGFNAQINAAMDGCAALEKNFKAANKLDEFHKRFNKMKKAEKDLDGLLNTAHTLAARVSAAEDSVTELNRKMKNLKKPGMKLQLAEKVVDLTIQYGSALGGLTDANIAKDAHSVLVATAALYNEMAGTMADMR